MSLDQFRYLLGYFLCKFRLRECARNLYFFLALRFLKRFPKETIQAAWLRRSTVTEDFHPVSSDIDLTILIEDKNLSLLFNNPLLQKKVLGKDIQFISRRFLKSWCNTGGFRNRQIFQWRQISGPTVNLALPVLNTPERLSFELAYEIHLLYRQLMSKMQLKGTALSNEYSIKKIFKELERVRLYWYSKDEQWITSSRSSIVISNNPIDNLKNLNTLCEVLLRSVKYPMNNYDWRPLILNECESGFLLDTHIDNRQAFITKNIDNFDKLILTYPDKFIAFPSYIQLIKGVGIHEQTHLNYLVKTNSYYREFSIQRLAHDLIGALLIEPTNLSQLYFCFFNIHQFYFAVTDKSLPGWKKIEESWCQNKTLPFSGSDLILECQNQLDLLESIS